MADEKFTKENIMEQVKIFSKKAEGVLKDEKKIRELIRKAQDWLKKGKDIPVIGDAVNDIVEMIDLLIDYVDGKYTEMPKTALISLVASLLYVISPIDLIPDFIPLIGYLDDVAVIAFVLGGGVSAELKKYREWKAAGGDASKSTDDIIDVECTETEEAAAEEAPTAEPVKKETPEDTAETEETTVDKAE